MDFGIVSIVLLVLAAVFVLAASKVLFKRHWLLQFLRGFIGFSLLAIAFIAVLVSINISTYKPLAQGQVLAHISFTETAPQEYQAVVIETGLGQETTYNLHGDMWQIDARSLRIALSNKPFYQLNSLSARYYALEQENTLAEKPFQLQNSAVGIDLWHLFKGKSVGIIAADDVSGSFLPIADGAVYTVTIGNNSLEAKPTNDIAKKVMNEWL